MNNAHLSPDEMNELIAETPLGRLGTPGDDTDGTELQVAQPVVLQIQLGQQWSGTEFQLKAVNALTVYFCLFHIYLACLLYTSPSGCWWNSNNHLNIVYPVKSGTLNATCPHISTYISG